MKALDETMNAKSLFGRRLRVLLAEKNMNQRELAAVLGTFLPRANLHGCLLA